MKRICVILVSLVLAGLSEAQTGEDFYLTGVADLIKGDNLGAVDMLTSSLDHGGPEAKVLMKRGEARYNMGELELAIRDFNEVNSHLPDVADLWLAKCHAAKGDENNAVSFLERHLRSEFRQPEEVIKKDPAFDALQLTDQWFLLWQGDWYGAGDEAVQEAGYYMERGNIPDALNEIELVIAKGFATGKVYAMRGRIHMEEGNFGPAVSDLTSAIDRDRNNLDYYLDRASANIGAGRFKEAVSDLSRVLKEEPERFDGYLLRAEAYAGMKSWDRAIDEVKIYLKYFDSDQHAIFLCGEYHFQKGEYLSALEYFNRNMKSDPHNALYFKARGKTYAMTHTGRYALYDLTMSLDLDPSDGETWLYLGIAELESGNSSAACSDFEKARRLGETRALEYIVDNCQ